MKLPPIEKLLEQSNGLIQHNNGRIYVRNTEIDLADVWEVVQSATVGEARAYALHRFYYMNGISLNTAQELVEFIFKHPVSVEDYYDYTTAADEAAAAVTPRWDAMAKAVGDGRSEATNTTTGQAESTVYRIPDGDLQDPTKPKWSLDQSLQEARGHIGLLHQEMAELKQHIANLQATAAAHVGHLLMLRGALMEVFAGIGKMGGIPDEEIQKNVRNFDDAIAGSYESFLLERVSKEGRIFRPIVPPHPGLNAVLSLKVENAKEPDSE